MHFFPRWHRRWSLTWCWHLPYFMFQNLSPCSSKIIFLHLLTIYNFKKSLTKLKVLHQGSGFAIIDSLSLLSSFDTIWSTKTWLHFWKSSSPHYSVFFSIVCWSCNFCSMHENYIITSMHTYLTGEKFGELTLFEQWWKKKLGKLIDQPIGY